MKTSYITTNELQTLLNAGLNGCYHIKAIGSILTLNIVLDNKTQEKLCVRKTHSEEPRIFRTPENLFDYVTRLNLYEGTLDLKEWDRNDTRYKWTREDQKVRLTSINPLLHSK